MMKVLHVPYCYYPDPVGGTEIYVESLAQNLRRRGVTVEIATAGSQESSDFHDGMPVHRFAVSDPAPDLRDFYGAGDSQAAASFGRILERSSPDIVHLHAWTSGVSLRLLRAAKRLDIPVVFTYHTPTVSCVRGTLLRWDSEICSGDIDTTPCAACMLHGKGVNLLMSQALGELPPAVGGLIGRAGLSGGIWTALRASELIELRLQAFRDLLAEADRVVAVCRWVRDLLIRNHMDPNRLTLSRQGLREQARPTNRQRRDSREIRIAFLGRMARVKGVHILIEALRRVKSERLKLDVYTVVQDEEGRDLFNAFSRLTAADSRIRILPALASTDVVATLSNYDLLAVPSQVLETGPLVVYEAFAAGLPVLGSDLGGIAELVEHESNGLLIEPASVEAWTDAIQRFADEPGLLARLQTGIPTVRTMDDAADEMLTLYRQLRPAMAASEMITAFQ